MNTALAPAQVVAEPASRARAIVHRTRGTTHGPITRLMSPGDLGEWLKPFVFLDLFASDGARAWAASECIPTRALPP
ncbi:hypothetical protein [Acidovorax sp. SUPP3334]|uniref:hypothetical protein n=1 Tax=Acidovorax sp. SUPP3334 TaxID=2920881 RepID=UPI0023DE68C2|nr:hypothetical protein [Acidovorax sp. SUPP3334]GKT22443.1 hypothetical protein AVHM3334_08460 [Acidovorax sp. SUPP3334]